VDSAPVLSSDYERTIESIQKQIGIDYSSAEKLFLGINYFAEGIQTNLTYLASSKDSFSEKDNIIKLTINDYFVSPKSQIQVSSLSHPDIYSYDIQAYLHDLSRLSNNSYTKVELIFRPDYLGIGRIEKLRSGKYEISVSMKQMFRGWNEGKIAYQDETRKKFRLVFDFKGGSASIKINEILVAETIQLDTDIRGHYK
jgi:ubiquitin